MVQTVDGDRRLVRDTSDRWTDRDIVVVTTPGRLLLHVGLTSPTGPVKRVHLRWRGDLSATRLIIGDAWERGYGDLEWRGWVPDRVMPWYCATFDGSLTHAYGVQNGRELVLLLAGGSRRRQSVGRRAERRRRRAARRPNARRVRRRVSRRPRRRVGVCRDARVLPPDVPPAPSARARAADSPLACIWQQRLVLGVRKEHRRHRARGRRAHRRIVSDGRESAVRRDRRRVATRSRRGQVGHRHLGSRQRKVRRHGGARRRRSTRGRSAGHLDSPIASAGERARFVAPGARPRDARPDGS